MSTIEGGGQFINNGLRLFYDAKNLSSYPMSGSTWFDILNSGLNGTLRNGITFDTNGFFILNGINQYISLPKSVGLANSIVNYSFGIWFKPANDILVGSTEYFILMEAQDSTGGASRPDVYLQFANMSKLGFRNFTSVGQDLLTTTENWYSNRWYNVYCTYELLTGTKKIYVNGVLENSITGVTGAYFNTLSHFNISGYQSGVSFLFPGSVSLFQLYTRTLTDIEVLKNFNLFKGRYNLL
jgi:hypothetical protein